jgi:hypothetical protein
MESMLGLAPAAYPAWLGEDDLAEFGAYREHSETAFDSGETLPEDRIDSTE